MPRSTAAGKKLAEYRRKRDFARTAEPSGDAASRASHSPSSRSAGTHQFIIQKHAASHLHFDLRLELGGVMKSWAVPKGPSLDPAVKRLAMEVEDHPMEYNAFEGTIPEGEYGGGSVMIWDRGTCLADPPTDGDDEDALRRGYRAGDLKFSLHGERLNGSFVLVRMRARAGSSSSKPQWLLIKHHDEFARPGSDIVAAEMTSAVSGRTMEEIRDSGGGHPPGGHPAGGWNRDSGITQPAGRSRPSRSRVAGPESPVPGPSARERAPARVPRTSLEPMYASVGTAPPTDGGWTFEPKYDGIRVLAYATDRSVKLITRNGNDKTKQFPEIEIALRKLAAQIRRSLVLDGEVVALIEGEAARFQKLQARMHVKETASIAEHAETSPAALIAFDLLLDGDDVLTQEPWSERRKQLEQRLRNRTSPRLRLGESIPNDGEAMLERARRDGWEGVIAKRMDAPYLPGVRSRAWLKLKIENRQEFVVGGYTEPRNTREHIGALLLGYFDNDRFIYVGHTGGGFTRDGLKAMHKTLKPLERKTSPFEEPPKTNEKSHWVRPEVVVEVKFNEWTADGKLRQPIYLGTREDKEAREVGREPSSVQVFGTRDSGLGTRNSRKRKAKSAAHERVPAQVPNPKSRVPSPESLISQLDRIEKEGGEGTLTLGRGRALDVTSLGKVFFPGDGFTKGDLMRYYARVARYLLPVIKDRPLVLKRFPNGIEAQAFFQQNAPENVPEGVRIEMIESDDGEEQRRVVGGDLLTLLWTVQLGAISVDPWHSRVRSLQVADYTILDLDPGPRAPFRRVVDVALSANDILRALGLTAGIKTSGSRGMHIVVPLPPRTPNEAGLIVAQLVATQLAEKHPRDATIERSVKSRPPAAVYADYLQNIRGKTVAGVYSARAKRGATVSTPLEWSELTGKLDPAEFTIETVPDRLSRTGDLWSAAMKRRNSLRAILEAGRVKGKRSKRL